MNKEEFEAHVSKKEFQRMLRDVRIIKYIVIAILAAILSNWFWTLFF